MAVRLFENGVDVGTFPSEVEAQAEAVKRAGVARAAILKGREKDPKARAEARRGAPSFQITRA